MSSPLVSIIIPHYRTAELARLCLRAIRHHTRDTPYEVIVIDNDSQDEASLSYLRSVRWIRLIERTADVGVKQKGHKEAVDLGFAAAQGPLVMAIHTDTIALRSDWLSWQVAQLESHPRCAAVGTDKLEFKDGWSQTLEWLKPLESVRLLFRDRRRPVYPPFIRSHCALYRKEVLSTLNLRYDDPEQDTAGRSIHLGLEAAGYEARLLSVAATMDRVAHISHATMVLHPDLGARTRTIRKGLTRMERFLARPEIARLLQDDTLDT